MRDYTLLEKLAEAAQGQREPAVIAAMLPRFAQAYFVSLGVDHEDRPVFAFQEQIDREIRILAVAKDGVSCREWVEDIDRKVENKLREIERLGQFPLSDEQADAIRVALSGNRISIVEGSAGAGKSTSSRAYVEILQSEGYKVFGAAPSWKAAAGLKDSAGIESLALQGLVKKIEKGKAHIDSKTVLVIDEAGMIDTRSMQILVEAAAKADAKIVLMGDTLQLSAVESGSPMRSILEQVPEACSRISTVRRQKIEWQRLQTERMNAPGARERRMDVHGRVVGPSQIDEALNTYMNHGNIVISDDREAAYEQVREEANRALEASRKHLAITVKNVDVVQLNRELRETYQAHGLIQGNDIVVEVLTRGVDKKDPKPEQISIAVGDRLLMGESVELKVLGSVDGKTHTIRRSEFVTIAAIETDLDGPTLTFNVGPDASGKDILVRGQWGDLIGSRGDFGKKAPLVPKFQHGYAVTIASSQGMTVEGNVSVLAAGGFNSNSTLVAMSRHKEDCNVTISGEVYRERVYKGRTQQDLRCATEEEVFAAFQDDANAAGTKVNAVDYILQKDLDRAVKSEIAFMNANRREAMHVAGGKSRPMLRNEVKPQKTEPVRINFGNWHEDWVPPDREHNYVPQS